MLSILGFFEGKFCNILSCRLPSFCYGCVSQEEIICTSLDLWGGWPTIASTEGGGGGGGDLLMLCTPFTTFYNFLTQDFFHELKKIFKCQFFFIEKKMCSNPSNCFCFFFLFPNSIMPILRWGDLNYAKQSKLRWTIMMLLGLFYPLLLSWHRLLFYSHSFQYAFYYDPKISFPASHSLFWSLLQLVSASN